MGDNWKEKSPIRRPSLHEMMCDWLFQPAHIFKGIAFVTQFFRSREEIVLLECIGEMAATLAVKVHWRAGI